jgi:hypothetical protein
MNTERDRMKAAQARALVSVLADMSFEDIPITFRERHKHRPASDHDHYLDQADRSERSERHLLIAMLKQRDGDNCYLCHTPLTPGGICIEHIIPLCHGGENEPHNVALACPPCNTRKGNLYVSLRVPSGAPCYHRPQHQREGATRP